MRLARLLTSLMVSGVALLATGMVLSVMPAGAAVRDPAPDYNTSDYRYTDKPASDCRRPPHDSTSMSSKTNSMRPSASESGWPCSNGTTC